MDFNDWRAKVKFLSSWSQTGHDWKPNHVNFIHDNLILSKIWSKHEIIHFKGYNNTWQSLFLSVTLLFFSDYFIQYYKISHYLIISRYVVIVQDVTHTFLTLPIGLKGQFSDFIWACLLSGSHLRVWPVSRIHWQIIALGGIQTHHNN